MFVRRSCSALPERKRTLQESLLILIGGDETTRHVISGGAWQLFLHPEQRRTLAADPSGIPTAVEEMLRWVSAKRDP
jgi:cytochrome P450 family 142 subfamily A polypeptide 1